MRSVAVASLLLLGCTVGEPDDLTLDDEADAESDGEGGDFDSLAATVPPVGTRVSLGGHPAWVHFTNPPAHNGDDRNILSEAIRLIRHTPKGEHIRAAIHSLTVNGVARALMDAHDRGVIVEVAEDGSDRFDPDPSPRQLHAKLGKSHVFCGGAQGGNNGCVTSDVSGIMHTKLMTFSHTEDPDGTLRDSVVWFGSANMTNATGAESFNNTVTIYGDHELFVKFNGYFQDLFQQRHFAGNNYYDVSSQRGLFGTDAARVYISPEQNSDLVENRLDDIAADDNCEIRASQAMIHDSRPELVTQLIRLKRGHCLVRVVGHGIQSQSLARLKAAGIPVRATRVHDKFIAVSARFAGSAAHRKLVFTGSHNWTESANSKNDEIFVRVEGEGVYNAYVDHFQDAFKVANPK